jgi:uncharacterized protein
LSKVAFGGFDTLWYHEFRLHLPRNPSARNELTLHSSRDFIYAVIFSSLAWLTWDDFWACTLGGLLIFEIIITLQDFNEEDRWRKVPSGERVTHALMGVWWKPVLLEEPLTLPNPRLKTDVKNARLEGALYSSRLSHIALSAWI